jgi:hypothetical protein
MAARAATFLSARPDGGFGNVRPRQRGKGFWDGQSSKNWIVPVNDRRG